MTDEHIVKSFDQDLRTLHGMIAEMGGLAEVQLEESIKVMVRRDAEKAARIVAGDKRIDDIELEMSKRATQMIAMRQPMADDLRAIICPQGFFNSGAYRRLWQERRQARCRLV